MDNTKDGTLESANRVYGFDACCPTIPAGGGDHTPKILMGGQVMNDIENTEWIWEVDGEKYIIRIRKLTPRECWRLMDFSDEDFEKAEQVNSNTQLYKEAGNSIVRNVLCAVFGQMFEGKEDAYKHMAHNHNFMNRPEG